MKILVVDDDKNSVRLIQFFLAKDGHEVDVAYDGDEALTKITPGVTQVVVTDWDMPRMNGIQLCRALRAADAKRQVYVVMLTAKDTRGEQMEGRLAGADDFVVKPIDRAKLQEAIKGAEYVVNGGQAKAAG